MNIRATLAGALATAGMAAGLLSIPAAASANSQTVLSSPLLLRFQDGTVLSRNAAGTTNFTPSRNATTLTSGSWTGYVQYNDGSKTYFCAAQTRDVSGKPATTLFLSAQKASWCL
ncbi:hypothetical protein Sme01_21110 [Sphaerisporangium melleum]|uniref:Secreted protein n=1 Tax=Sphaerisporangium melleum TaxID=321316 RepID=A0A917RMR6_9ACTN|nr:hypothetical protein [Sphaerisporangium melleum]GGL15840.1 hypothetical protein GCM10007964_67290 [Sphaerisporangium melleum]GII69635.1 hypothetical protein Sme01_21110 [Sphaerisporangium melleum]